MSRRFKRLTGKQRAAMYEQAHRMDVLETNPGVVPTSAGGDPPPVTKQSEEDDFYGKTAGFVGWLLGRKG